MIHITYENLNIIIKYKYTYFVFIFIFLMLGKAISCMQSFNHWHWAAYKWALAPDPSLPRDKEPRQIVGLSLCVGTSCFNLDSASTLLSLLPVCASYGTCQLYCSICPPQGRDRVLQLPWHRKGGYKLVLLVRRRDPWFWGTDVHHRGWSWSVSFLCEEVAVSSSICLHCAFLCDSVPSAMGSSGGLHFLPIGIVIIFPILMHLEPSSAISNWYTVLCSMY